MLGAQKANLRLAVDPHTPDSIKTARQALPLVKAVNHPNVGLSLNLAHELRNGSVGQLPEIVHEVKDYLSGVTINGADRPPEGSELGWGRLIQPLGRGGDAAPTSPP